MLDLIPRSETSVDTLDAILEKTRDLVRRFVAANASAKRDLLQEMIQRIDIAPGQLAIAINGGQLVALITKRSAITAPETVTLKVQFQIRRRGVESKLIVKGQAQDTGGKDQMLIETIAKGHAWFDEIASGQTATIPDIAKPEGVVQGDVSTMMSFAFLAPDIIETIVEGKQPFELAAERLKRAGSLPLTWPDQRRRLGSTLKN